MEGNGWWRWTLAADRQTHGPSLITWCKGQQLLTAVTWHHWSHDHWTCGVRFPNGSQFEPRICIARFLRFWDIKLQRYWGHELDLLESRDVITHQSRDHWTPDLQVSIGGPLKPSVYLAPHCWDTMCQTLSQAAKHIPIESALIPFLCLGAKLGVTAFRKFVIVAAA